MDVITDVGVPSDANVVNVVATFRLMSRKRKNSPLIPIEINLKKICMLLRDLPFKYNPRKFAAMTILMELRALQLKGTVALTFSSGNVVFTGGTTEERALASAHFFVWMFVTMTSIPVELSSFAIANIVCNMKVDFEIDLESMNTALGNKAKLTTVGPRSFPACRVRPYDDRKTVFLVYVSGAVVLTGAKTRGEVHENHVEAYRLCKRHRKKPEDLNLPRAMLHLRNRKQSTSALRIASIDKRLDRWTAEKEAQRMEDSFTKSGVKECTANLTSEIEGIEYFAPLEIPAPNVPMIEYSPTVPHSAREGNPNREELGRKRKRRKL